MMSEVAARAHEWSVVAPRTKRSRQLVIAPRTNRGDLEAVRGEEWSVVAPTTK